MISGFSSKGISKISDTSNMVLIFVILIYAQPLWAEWESNTLVNFSNIIAKGNSFSDCRICHRQPHHSHTLPEFQPVNSNLTFNLTLTNGSLKPFSMPLECFLQISTFLSCVNLTILFNCSSKSGIFIPNCSSSDHPCCTCLTTQCTDITCWNTIQDSPVFPLSFNPSDSTCKSNSKPNTTHWCPVGQGICDPNNKHANSPNVHCSCWRGKIPTTWHIT